MLVAPVGEVREGDVHKALRCRVPKDGRRRLAALADCRLVYERRVMRVDDRLQIWNLQDEMLRRCQACSSLAAEVLCYSLSIRQP